MTNSLCLPPTLLGNQARKLHLKTWLLDAGLIVDHQALAVGGK
jgi:hypothetical protein